MPSRDGEKALGAALKSGDFAPAYYLHGDEEYRKEEALRAMLERAVDPATRDFNLEIMRGGEVEAEMLGSLLGTPPMMADRRVVVIRDVGALKKDARNALDRYLERPAPDVLLVLMAAADGKPDKALAARSVAVELGAMSPDQIPRWITRYAERQLAATITPEAARLLQEAVGTELSQLRVELDKLGSFVAPGQPIDEGAVAAIVGVRPGETMGAFLDAVAKRDAREALSLLPGVFQQPRTGAVTTIMALAAQTIAIGWAQSARARGASSGQLHGLVFDLLRKSGSVYTGRPWGDAVAAWARNADRWTESQIDDALDALLAAEAAAKGTRLSSEEQLIANLVLALCGAPASRRAA